MEYPEADFDLDTTHFAVSHRPTGTVFRFDGYPDPISTIGEAILANTARPMGRVVITHLGVGLADLVFADAIVRAAEARGLGVELPR